MKLLLKLTIFIFGIALLIFYGGCGIKEKYVYQSLESYQIKSADAKLNECINAVKNNKELKEWFFVNEKKLYTCGFMAINDYCQGGCIKEDFLTYSTYEEVYKNWLSHYGSLKKLEKKWKNKPLPEYLQKAYQYNKLIKK